MVVLIYENFLVNPAGNLNTKTSNFDCEVTFYSTGYFVHQYNVNKYKM